MQPVDDRCVSCAPLGERASHRLVELASVVEDVCFPRGIEDRRGIDSERHRAGTKQMGDGEDHHGGTDQPYGGRRYLPSPGWMDTREDGTSQHSNADVTGNSGRFPP
jgi:hypothetical protein